MNTRIVSFTNSFGLQGFEDPYVYGPEDDGVLSTDRLNKKKQVNFREGVPEDLTTPRNGGNNSSRRRGILRNKGGKSEQPSEIKDLREFIPQIRPADMEERLDFLKIPNFHGIPKTPASLRMPYAGVLPSSNDAVSISLKTFKKKALDPLSHGMNGYIPNNNPDTTIFSHRSNGGLQFDGVEIGQVGESKHRPRRQSGTIFQEPDSKPKPLEINNNASVVDNSSFLSLKHIMSTPILLSNRKKGPNPEETPKNERKEPGPITIAAESVLNDPTNSVLPPSLNRPPLRNRALFGSQKEIDVNAALIPSRPDQMEITLLMRLGDDLGYEFILSNTMLICYDFVHQLYYRRDLATSLTQPPLKVFSMVQIGKGTLVITGGINTLEGEITNAAYFYDFFQDYSFPLVNMISPRLRHSLVYLENQNSVLALGGQVKSQIKTKSVELFSMRTRTWTRIAPMKYERAECSAIYTKSNYCVYVFGGCDRFQENQIVEKYDIIMNVWIVLPFALDVPMLSSSYLLATPSKGSPWSSSTKYSRNLFEDTNLIFGRDSSLNRMINCSSDNISRCDVDLFITDSKDKIITFGEYLIKIHGSSLGTVELYETNTRKHEISRFTEKT